MANKLWEKNYEINHEIERFTVGRDREMDLYLAKYDVLGSMAHITMLESIGLLEKEELKPLLDELKNIYELCEKGEFVIEDGIEDVHSQVELMLTRKLGDMGKKIHSGRSRNDQVLVDLKLFTRHQLKEIADAVKVLFDELLQKSNQYKEVLMPGYTHLQIAMPSSFGLWFGAYAESLADDMLFLQAAYKMTNRNPLGSAAGYGSSFPLNRTMTTQLLGFNYVPTEELVNDDEESARTAGTNGTVSPAAATYNLAALPPERERIVAERLDKWCQDKGYRDSNANMLTLSRMLLIPRAELTRYFEQNLKLSFRIWLSEIRFKAAQEMMRDYPDYSNDIISAECGFSSRTHLYRIFKNRAGCTPTAWRERGCPILPSQTGGSDADGSM